MHLCHSWGNCRISDCAIHNLISKETVRVAHLRNPWYKAYTLWTKNQRMRLGCGNNLNCFCLFDFVLGTSNKIILKHGNFCLFAFFFHFIYLIMYLFFMQGCCNNVSQVAWEFEIECCDDLSSKSWLNACF